MNFVSESTGSRRCSLGGASQSAIRRNELTLKLSGSPPQERPDVSCQMVSPRARKWSLKDIPCRLANRTFNREYVRF